MKLDIKAFGLTCGLVWGFGVFALTWWVIFFDGASDTPLICSELAPHRHQRRGLADL